MMKLMRQYQKYIYFFVTVMIVISFSFFGTYGALTEEKRVDPIAFTAVDGSKIYQSELDQMVQFLSTDIEDLFTFIQGRPNVLNDGVIRKDVIEKGIAEEILANFREDVKKDLLERQEKEKRYQFYSHPQMPFISFQNILNMISPEIPKKVAALQESSDPTSDQALKLRVELFLISRRLPDPLMRQFLQRQMQQFGKLKPDPMFSQTDLSLFSYHTVEDWFGPKFLRLAAEYVINGAIIAQQKGFSVSREETLAFLRALSELAQKQMQKVHQEGVPDARMLMRDQLRVLGIDQSQAIGVWQQVMTFRRMFDQVESSVVLDRESIWPIYSYSQEKVQGSLFQLPAEFQFNTMDQVKEFQVYLEAISELSDDPLALPTHFLSPEVVAKTTPEMVERQVKLQVKKVTKKSLQAKVTIKEMWDWEGQEKNFTLLQKQFPILSDKKGVTAKERLVLLDQLDTKTRVAVDTFARQEIVNLHNKWIDEALEQAVPYEVEIGLREVGGPFPFEGVSDRKALIDQLLAQNEVKKFTGDNKTFYQIKVLDRAKQSRIVLFSALREEGVLAKLMEKRDQATFDPLVQALQKVSGQTEAPPALLAAYRFKPYMDEMRAKLVKNLQADLFRPEEVTIQTQWKLVKTPIEVTRAEPNSLINFESAFELNSGAFSQIDVPVNGDIHFFVVHEKGVDEDEAAFMGKLFAFQGLLGREIGEKLSQNLLNEMLKKRALSIEWMKN